MKYIFDIVLSTLLVSVTVALINEYDEKCISELHLNKEEISHIWTNNLYHLPLIYPTGNLKCYNKCIHEQMGLIENDKIAPDYIAEIDEASQSDEWYQKYKDKCLSIKAKDGCELTNKLVQCELEFYHDHPVEPLPPPTFNPNTYMKIY